MNNAFDEIRSALCRAHEVQRACEVHADEMAKLLVGNMRFVSPGALKLLKRELRNFNIHTERWKPR